MDKKREELVKSLTAAIEGCFSRLADKSALCEENLDRLLRLKAEFENYKKRSEKEKQEYVKFSNADVMMQLLPVVESFEMGMDSSKDAKNPKEILRGMQMIFSALKDVLKKNGIVEIETKGKVFDPHLNDVVEYVESRDVEEGTIVEEVQKGYMFNGRVLRPAKVKVAGNPSPCKDKE